MKTGTLDDLKNKFEEWRSTKKYRQQAVPAELLKLARQAVRKHGVNPVARATKIERKRLKESQTSRCKKRKVRTEVVPAYTQMELVTPSTTSLPFAELETPTGLRLRLFKQTEETVGLLATICRTGEK